MSNVDATILLILAWIIGFSALIVAGVLIFIGVVVRRILLRIEHMVGEVDDAGMRIVGESERMIALAKATNGSLLMRFASGIAGLVLAKHMVHKAQAQKNYHAKK